MIYLDHLAQFLDQFFGGDRFSHPDVSHSDHEHQNEQTQDDRNQDPNGIYCPSQRPIHRLGLALEPWSQLQGWVEQENLDALFLHRPWQLKPHQLPSDVGVLSYHLSFDEQLTLGFNPRLANILAMSGLEVIGKKAGRPIGMIGKIPCQTFEHCCRDVEDIFGGQDQVAPGKHLQISQVAVVGAMTDALVREAAERGVHLYMTGQWRKPAQQAVVDTGIGVIAVGHHRSEEWGLRAIAGILRERWAKLEVLLPPLL